jgi:DNA-binding beta-propeller fold protein YncE
VSHFVGSTAATAGYSDGVGTNALLNQPAHIAADPTSGALFIADYAIGLLRRVTIATQAVTTLMGYGTVPGATLAPVQALTISLFNPSGVALSLDRTKLYVNDRGNRCVRAIDLPSGTATTLAGSCAAAAAWTDGLGTNARSFPRPQSPEPARSKPYNP